jgi:ATP-binding cassette, subfamily B (MDR/TAP), member 7
MLSRRILSFSRHAMPHTRRIAQASPARRQRCTPLWCSQHRAFSSLPGLNRQNERPQVKHSPTVNQASPEKLEAGESIKPESFEKPNPPAKPAAAEKKDILLAEQTVSNKEQRKVDLAILKEMAKYLWPKGEFGTKVRVGTALGLLVGAKVLNVQVPFYFKSIVDSMNIDFLAVGGTAWTVAGSMIVAYGVTRVGAALFQELRNAVFASVAQKAIRNVACNVFRHLLRLDLNFHLTRQTGGLTRALDRGTKGISFILTSMLFHIFPTFLEISMVCGILTYQYGPQFAAITGATMLAYTAFTITTTSWRTKFRKSRLTH